MIPYGLLQVSPEQFDSAVGQLSKSSVELAEAAADFGVLKVVFGVFMAFFLILILMFLYQMLTMTKKVNEIHSSCKTVSGMVSETSNRTLGKASSFNTYKEKF